MDLDRSGKTDADPILVKRDSLSGDWTTVDQKIANVEGDEFRDNLGLWKDSRHWLKAKDGVVQNDEVIPLKKVFDQENPAGQGAD